MSSLLQRRLTPSELGSLVESAPSDPAMVSDHCRASLAGRLRAVPATGHRRLDAWMVEQAGRASRPFAWSPATARRNLGNNALRRLNQCPDTTLNAVRDELAEQLVRAVRGFARSGSLAHWLAGVSHPVLGLITAEAVDWVTQTLECAQGLGEEWRVAPSDAYYDVAGARTTLRGRRDIIVDTGTERVVVRIRSGMPGKSAGPGLRSDMVVETLAHHAGLAPRRFLGVWPDAGIILGVDGTSDNVRAGARDFVRAAVAQRRHGLVATV